MLLYAITLFPVVQLMILSQQLCEILHMILVILSPFLSGIICAQTCQKIFPTHLNCVVTLSEKTNK